MDRLTVITLRDRETGEYRQNRFYQSDEDREELLDSIRADGTYDPNPPRTIAARYFDDLPSGIATRSDVVNVEVDAKGSTP
jgi:hypothetical protein